MGGRLIAELNGEGEQVTTYLYARNQLLAMVQRPPPNDGPQNTYLLEQSDPGITYTGNWTSGKQKKGRAHEKDYRVAAGSAEANIKLTNLVTGTYDLFAWWPGHVHHNPEATLDVNGAEEPITLDQTGSSGQWVLLGTFALNKGSELNITGGEGTVVDAFRLEERVDLRPQFSDPELYYSHNDHLGSPVAMTDAQGQIVWDVDRKPFGEVSYRINRATNNLRFPGQYFDEETGLHYNYFRDYDPTAGRYIQSDPIGQNGGVNTYAYVENNPFKNIDPLGLRGIGVRIIQIYPMSRSNRQIDQVLQEGLHNPEQACLLGQCFPIVPQQCKFTTCDLSRNLENSDVCPAETNSAEFRATNDRGCKCLKY